MPAPTERQLAILRLMHANVPLVPRDNGTAHLDVAALALGVRPASVAAMLDAGWMESTGTRYTITEAGRDVVRVRDFVADFISDSPTNLPTP